MTHRLRSPRRVRPRALVAGGGLLLLAGAFACAYPNFHAERGPVPDVGSVPLETVPMPPPEDPELTGLGALPLLRLEGDGYARGYRYGHAKAASWHRAVDLMYWHAVDLVREYVPPKFMARTVVSQYSAHLAQQFAGGKDPQCEAFFPSEYRAYLQGIADGAGLDTSGVQRLIAFIMLSDASCSGFVAFGPATEDGRLLQLRSLDWGSADLPAAQEAILLVHEPPGRHRYLSIGYVGVVGSVTGINEAGISVTEVGAGSNDWTARGLPMPLLIERVLAEAGTLDEAVRIFRTAPGTGGYNFIVGSARVRRAAVIEKTARRCAVFEVGPDNYADNPHFHAFAGFDCRASVAAAPEIRALQHSWGGPDGSPVGSAAYEERYRRQIEVFEKRGRKLDLEGAFEIGRAVARKDNLQSVVFDFERGRVYVRNQAWFKDGRKPASEAERMRLVAGAQPPAVLDLRRIFPPR